jgi:hypothetical protein
MQLHPGTSIPLTCTLPTCHAHPIALPISPELSRLLRKRGELFAAGQDVQTLDTFICMHLHDKERIPLMIVAMNDSPDLGVDYIKNPDFMNIANVVARLAPQIFGLYSGTITLNVDNFIGSVMMNVARIKMNVAFDASVIFEFADKSIAIPSVLLTAISRVG